MSSLYYIVLAVFAIGFLIHLPKLRKPLSEDDGSWFYGAVFRNRGYRLFHYRDADPLKTLHTQGYFGIPWIAMVFYHYLWPWKHPGSFYWMKIIWHSLSAAMVSLTAGLLWGNSAYALLAGLIYHLCTGLSHLTWSDLTYAEVFLALPLCLAMCGLHFTSPWTWLFAGIFAAWAVQIKIVALPLSMLLPIPFYQAGCLPYLVLFYLGFAALNLLPALLIACSSTERKGHEVKSYLLFTFGPLLTAIRLILHTPAQNTAQRSADIYTATKWQTAGSLGKQWRTMRDRFVVDWAAFRPLFLLSLFALLMPDRWVLTFMGIFIVFMLILAVQKSYYLPKFGLIWLPVSILSAKSAVDIFYISTFIPPFFYAFVILCAYYLIASSVRIFHEFKHASDLAGFDPAIQPLFAIPAQIGALLKERAHPGDKLLVWGNFANIYLYSNLECMNPSYLFLYPNRILQEAAVRRSFDAFPAPEWLVGFNYHTPDDWNPAKIRNELHAPYDFVTSVSITDDQGAVRNSPQRIPFLFPILRRNDRVYREVLIDRSQHKPELALHWLGRAQDIFPNDHELRLRLIEAETGTLPDPPDGSYADRKLFALQLCREGRYVEAKPLLDELLMEDQSDFRIYLHLAECYYLENDLRSALTAIRKSVELNPLSAEGCNDMGVIFNALGESEQARSCFVKALRLYPNYREASQNLQQLADPTVMR